MKSIKHIFTVFLIFIVGNFSVNLAYGQASAKVVTTVKVIKGKMKSPKLQSEPSIKSKERHETTGKSQYLTNLSNGNNHNQSIPNNSGINEIW